MYVRCVDLSGLVFFHHTDTQGGDIKGVLLGGCCKHVVGVCDDRDKARGADDGTTGATGGDDIRGVQLGGCYKHSVVVCDDRDKTGGSDDGTAGETDGGDIREV